MEPRIKNCIYRLTLPNNKHYIGQTNDFYNRMKQHKSTMKNHPEKNPALYADMSKYGYENIQKNVLVHDVPAERMDKLERFFIDLYDTYNESRGYNQLPGLDFYERFNTALKDFIEYKPDERLNNRTRTPRDLRLKLMLEYTNEYNRRKTVIDDLAKEYRAHIEIIKIRYSPAEYGHKCRILGHNKSGGYAIFKTRNATPKERRDREAETKTSSRKL